MLICMAMDADSAMVKAWEGRVQGVGGLMGGKKGGYL